MGINFFLQNDVKRFTKHLVINDNINKKKSIGDRKCCPNDDFTTCDKLSCYGWHPKS